ncbi:MAG: gamma-glutamyl-gamma-aminobutyrate hydrolase family protein, partial [Cytophagaceae bacterium]|nr:gamma-glutamyl-gamma-aminobutyrate hydrolase family protein [Gemmatimonadaceae bacterium]
QGIKTLAPGLAATPVAPDGLIGAVDMELDPFVIGVQWHPEVFEMTDPHTRHVFRSFIETSARFGGK